MRTCWQCGRSYTDARRFCPYCDLELHAGVLSDTIEHINYLLSELSSWIAEGWVTDQQAANLRREYQARRVSLLSPASVLSSRPKPSAPFHSVGPTTPPEPKPAEAGRPHWMAALLEQQNISYWHLVGSILLIAGLIGLVHWTWATLGKYLVFGLMLALTGGLFALARSRALAESQITRMGLLAISALLVPLDVIAANVFHLAGLRCTGDQIGLMSAVISLPLLYWLAHSERARCFSVMLAVDIAATVHFGLQFALPQLLGTHDLDRVYGAYGWVMLPIALGYFLQAKRLKDDERRSVWLISGHAMVLTSLILSVCTNVSAALGVFSSQLLFSALIYACAAWLLEARPLVYVTCALAIVSGLMALTWRQVDFASHWYVAVLVSQAISLVFFLTSRAFQTIQKQDLADAYKESALAVTGLAVIAHAIAALIGAQSVFELHTPLHALIGTTASAVLLLLVFDRMALRMIGDAVIVYVTVLAGLIAAYVMPTSWMWHGHPHLGVLLVLACGILRWGRREEASAIVCGFAGVTVCAILALIGTSPGMTGLALGLFFGFWLTSGRQFMYALGAIITLTVLVLQQEHVLLPLLHQRYGWEPNYGFGLLGLTILVVGCLWRQKSLRLDDQIAMLLQQSAITLGVANAVLQAVLTMDSAYLYSPLLLLTFGIVFCAGIAFVRRSLRAADACIVLTGFSYVAVFSYLNILASMDVRRELMAVGMLLIASLCFCLMANRLQHTRPVYAFAFTIALAFVQFLHWYWDPAETMYSLAMFPWIAMMLALGHLQMRRHDSAIWGQPLYQSGFILTLCALMPVMGNILKLPGLEDQQRIVMALGAYGVLYGILAILRRSMRHSYVACTLITGAIVFVLMHLTPPLVESILGFAISLVGLSALGLAVVLSLKKSDLEYLIVPISHTAAALALLATVVALVGFDGPSNKFSVYALLVAGTIFLGNAALSQIRAWQHVGMLTYLIAYSAFLVDHIGAPQMSQSDFYLIPVGLYVLGLGIIAKRRSEQADVRTYYLGGLLLILTPTFVAAWNTSGSPLHPLLLVTECVATIFWGLASRVKIIVGIGATFLAALIELETRGTLTHLHWAIYATALGLAIIGSAIFFEKRRNDVLRWGKTIQDNLREWD